MKGGIKELEDREKELAEARDSALLPIGNLVHDTVHVSDNEVLLPGGRDDTATGRGAGVGNWGGGEGRRRRPVERIPCPPCRISQMMKFTSLKDQPSDCASTCRHTRVLMAACLAFLPGMTGIILFCARSPPHALRVGPCSRIGRTLLTSSHSFTHPAGQQCGGEGGGDTRPRGGHAQPRRPRTAAGHCRAGPRHRGGRWAFGLTVDQQGVWCPAPSPGKELNACPHPAAVAARAHPRVHHRRQPRVLPEERGRAPEPGADQLRAAGAWSRFGLVGFSAVQGGASSRASAHCPT